MKLLLALLFSSYVLAVKDHLFRKCDQNPFCKRNRHYGDNVQDSPYSVDLSTIQYRDNLISVTVFKTIGDSNIELYLNVYSLPSGGLRLTIDEQRPSAIDAGDKVGPNPKRFDFIGEYLTTERSPIQYEVIGDNEALSITYGDSLESATIQAEPFQVTVYRGEKPMIILNGDKKLNFEHYRSVGESNQLLTAEIDDGMWQDKHDGFTDKKVKGPESVALDIAFQGAAHVYGIPEHADKLNLRSTRGENQGDHAEPYRLFNVDIFEYEVDSPMAMYGAIPFMQSQGVHGSAGVFWANPSDTYVDISRQTINHFGKPHVLAPATHNTHTHWMSENGLLDVVLFTGGSPQDISKQYGELTGFAQMPQQWALGYHQCRWNYNSQSDVLGVSKNLEASGFPFETIWLDIEYTDGKKYFTWKTSTFPDHIGMMKELDVNKHKLVAIIDPHIKADKDYEVYKAIMDSNTAVMNSNGEPYHGHCWPGESIWIDSMNPESQKVWDHFFSKEHSFGGNATNLFVWNDMNEHSVFNGPESSMPKDNLNYGNWQQRDVHNIMGLTVFNMTEQSLLKRYNNEQRPFMLTRSFFSGSQKLSGTWTGDNQAKWEYLRIAVPMLLTSGVAGMPFNGADVGGFFGDPSMELLTRWYQAGIWYPFFRAHAHIDSKRREPYLFAESEQKIMRDAVKLRYKLLPSWYTAFHEASVNGTPVLVPMFYSNPDNDEVYDLDDQFYLGSTGILVKPVTGEAQTSVTVVLPDDETYYNFWNLSQTFNGNKVTLSAARDEIPLLVKGGTMHTTRERERRSAELMAHDPYTLTVALSKVGDSVGSLYVDDAVSYDYISGDYAELHISFSDGKLAGVVSGTPTGSFARQTFEKIVIAGTSATSARITQNGKTWKASVKSLGNVSTVRLPRIQVGYDFEVSLE